MAAIFVAWKLGDDSSSLPSSMSSATSRRITSSSRRNGDLEPTFVIFEGRVVERRLDCHSGGGEGQDLVHGGDSVDP